MSPFWAGLFENLRGRGRNPAWFIVALPALLLSVFITTQIPAETFHDYIMPTLLCAAVPAMVWLIRAFVQARARNRERLARHALSDDERNKARLKLVRHQSQLPPKNSLVLPG